MTTIISFILFISCDGNSDYLSSDRFSDSIKTIVLDSGQGFSYEVSSSKTIIITGITIEGEEKSVITVPPTIKEMEVTVIASGAFSGSNQCLRKIILPDSIIDIRYSAFSSCSWLTNINIPKNIARIGAGAFSNCEYLSSEIVLPKSLKIIGNRAFQGCRRIISLRIENEMPPIAGSNIFLNCPALTSIYVPASAIMAYKTAPGWSDYSSKIVGY